MRKELSMEEVLQLKDGTKVIFDTEDTTNILCTKEGSDLKTVDGDYYYITAGIWECYYRHAYEYDEEEIVKDKLCNYCEGDSLIKSNDNWEISIDDTSEITIEYYMKGYESYQDNAYFKVNYCPMCGRRL